MKHELFFGAPMHEPDSGTRFRKGQSGNPKGRPKANLSLDVLNPGSFQAISLKVARRNMTLREAGMPREVAAIEAILLAQQKSALQGSPIAQRHAIDRTDKLAREEQRALEEESAIYRQYIAESRATIDAAKSKGEPEPILLPHPDDIILRPAERARIFGPITEQDRQTMYEHIALREALLWQAGLDWRCSAVSESAPTLEHPLSAYVLALPLNATLPPRLRKSDAELQWAFQRASQTGKRALFKIVRDRWRHAGYRVRRGLLFPPLGVTVQRQKDIIEQVKIYFYE